jgi:hypothetical protein
MDRLQTVATILVVIGAALTGPLQAPFWGCAIGAASNLCWFEWARERRAWGLCVTNALILVLNLLGIAKWSP